MTEYAPDGSPLVSVVIPTYGRPDAVLEALDSVEGQTYDPIEVIVVDDHSPEPVEPSIRAASHPSLWAVECLRHEENKGANAARNTGIEAAKGEFVAFLDDDDLWKPETVEREVATFERTGPEVGVVYAGSVHEVDGNVVGEYIPEVSGNVLKDLFRGRRIAPFSNVMVRADVIKDAGLPDENLPSLQDREWYFRLAQHCMFEPVPAALVVHRASADERISDDFESKRDVSYPRIVDRHRPLAAEYGIYYERRFLSALSKTVGASGLRNGHYRDAVRFLLLSLWYYPFVPETLLYLLAAVGGRFTYRPAIFLKRTLGQRRQDG